MHTVWKGSISFGLVNVPIRLHSATESKDVKFRYLHRACNTPIEYHKVCPTCHEEVPAADIVRGVEYAPNQFVILSEDELAAVSHRRSDTIDIVDFVELSDIDPVFFDRTYYVSAESASVRAYRLLARAMEETNKIAIAKTILRSAQTLACLRVSNGMLVMETLFWPDEVRPVEELPFANSDAPVAENELAVATQLVRQLSTPFTPEKYRDERRETLLSIISNKAQESGEAKVVAGNKDNIVDLMQTLQKSLEMTSSQKAPTPKKGKRKSS